MDDARVSSRVLRAAVAELACECGFASIGAVVVEAVLPEALVTWSAGSDSGTVCRVVRIVVDMFAVSRGTESALSN